MANINFNFNNYDIGGKNAIKGNGTLEGEEVIKAKNDGFNVFDGYKKEDSMTEAGSIFSTNAASNVSQPQSKNENRASDDGLSLLNYFSNVSEELKQSLRVDPNYNKMEAEYINSYMKSYKLEQDLQDANAKLASAKTDSEKYAAGQDIEKIKLMQQQEETLQNGTIDEIKKYIEFVSEWEDGQTHDIKAFNQGELDKATTYTTVTLENGQKVYKDNNGVYYAPERRHPTLPDYRQVIDVKNL